MAILGSLEARRIKMKYFVHLAKRIFNHRWALLAGFCVGFFIILPTLISIYNIGFENFKGVYPIFNKDEIHYLAMTKEVLDGYEDKGNVFLSEHKSSPNITPGLTEKFFVLLSGISSFSIPLIFAINDFLLPFIGFILLYFLFFNITKNKKIANIFSLIFYLLFLFTFGRPINPQFSFIFLTLGLLFIWKIFENLEINKQKLLYAVLLGIDIGVLAYIYPYFWTALFVLYAVAIFLFILKTKKVAVIKNFFITLFVLGVLCVPYIINLVKATSHSFYKETIERLGILNNHWPATYVNVFLLSLALLVIFMIRRKMESRNYIFSLALLISGILLNWQNVVTGKYLQFSSHYYQVSLLFIFISLAFVFISLAGSFSEIKKINLKNIPAYLLIIILIVFIFNRQSNEIVRALSARATSDDMHNLQGYRSVFDWLNVNTETNSVILALDDSVAGYLPIYTHNNLYSYGYAGYYLMSDSEMEDRWVRQNIFNEKIDADYIIDNNRGIWLNKFIDNYQNKKIRNKIIGKLTNRNLTEPSLLPDIYVDRVLAKYNEVRKENLEKALKKYEIDYILLDRKIEDNKRIEFELKKEKFLELIKEFDNIAIYKVN